ncbi:MAG: DUF1080 domain-containing protein [Prolixibacteraceae bacterium]|nr:DUF1080 domain-containing protein [Prolixibacteraceae bacterium]
MKKCINLLFVILILSVNGLQAQNDWKELFNGRDLGGWEVLNGDATYEVKNGAIEGTSVTKSPNTFLVTETAYTNFILEYEMKMDEGLNSGVQIRSHSNEDYKNGRVHGLQVECEDTRRGWAGGLYDEARKGWRYPLDYNPPAKKAFKKGEWNTFKVVAFNNHIMTWVNGIPAANLVEEKTETGFIGLQVHGIGNKTSLAGKKIKWKNIRIREIEAADFDAYKGMEAPEVSFLKNQLTEREKYQGWELLWDGKTTKGWKGAKLDHFPEKGWSINDGILKVHDSDGGESANGGDIVTKKQYKSFILVVDFSITKGANSGIKYFVDTELNKGEGSSIGCEFQILDDRHHPDAKMGVNGNRTLGSLYDLIRANGLIFNPYLPREKYVNGYENWNRAKIVVDGNKVQHFLNGIKVVEYERNTQMWKALVAYSKYSKWPDFGEYEKGNILLQDHGNEVEFKNIKIKEL